jgi:glycosyltransferase involved in cell wall biosynthesis
MAGVERAVEQLARVLNAAPVFDTQIHTFNADKGAVSLRAGSRLAGQVIALAAQVRRSRPPAAIVAVSQNLTGLLRDCALILVLRVNRVQVYGWVHGAQLPDYLSSGLPGRCLVYPLRLVAGWIVPSSPLETDLARVVARRPIVAIPHPLDLDLFAPPDSRPLRDVDLAFVGKIAATKGWQDFLAATSSLESEAGIVVEIVGELIPLERNVPGSKGRITRLTNGPDRPGWAFREFASDEELVALYRRSRVVVVPSWSESFCYVAAEAMASGAIVVGYRTPGLKFLFGNSLDTWLADVQDIEGLTSRIRQALALSSTDYEEWSRKFSARARLLLDEDRIRSEWAAIIPETL